MSGDAHASRSGAAATDEVFARSARAEQMRRQAAATAAAGKEPPSAAVDGLRRGGAVSFAREGFGVLAGEVVDPAQAVDQCGGGQACVKCGIAEALLKSLATPRREFIIVATAATEEVDKTPPSLQAAIFREELEGLEMRLLARVGELQAVLEAAMRVTPVQEEAQVNPCEKRCYA